MNSRRPVRAVTADQRLDRRAAEHGLRIAFEPLLDHGLVHRAVVGRDLQVALVLVGGHALGGLAAGPVGGEAAADRAAHGQHQAAGAVVGAGLSPSPFSRTRRPNSENTSVADVLLDPARGQVGLERAERARELGELAVLAGELAGVGVEPAPVDRDDPRAEVRRQQVRGGPQAVRTSVEVFG